MSSSPMPCERHWPRIDMYLSVSALVIVFYTSSISCFIPNLPSDIHYVGCYSTTFVQENGIGDNVNPLTWEICIRLCMEKDTRYAGLESMTSTCYCGNNLAQQSEKKASYMCDEECYSDKRKTCGGDGGLLSLYQIKNSSSFSFLITTDNGLAFFKNNRLTPNFVSMPKITKIKSVYSFAENAVYFYSHKYIYKSQYFAMMMKHLPATMALVDLGEEAFSLALDWVQSKLFWSLHSSIVESNLDGSNRREVVITESPTLDLTVDPYDRKLLYIRNGSVIRFDLNSNKIGNSNLFQYNRFKLVTNLAVDLHKKIVYAIGFYDSKRDGVKNLVSTDYDGVTFRVLLRSRDLNGAFSISAVNDQLFWAASHNQQRMLYSFHVPENNVLTTPKKLASLPQNVVGAVFYHEDAQTPGETYFCQKLKCSHICTYTLENSAKCGCPQLMILKNDHRTCKDIPGLQTIDSEVDEANEFDDDIFNLSINLPKRGKSTEKKSRRKGSKGESRKKKRRRSRTKSKSRHSKHENSSSNLTIKSRSMPFTILNDANITYVNSTI